MTNLILATDSYKLNHWKQYPDDTTGVYSYFESRTGAEFPYTVFFGLQPILRKLEGVVVTPADVTEAALVAKYHFGDESLFNAAGWNHIIDVHGGCLPLRIKAVQEGTVVPTGNVLMTVENTCPECYWLTNAVESLLTHVWYPSTVATLSRHTIDSIGAFLDMTADSRDGLPFMLHDFGYRGSTSDESASIAGAAHLVNSVGTDTLLGMLFAVNHYGADITSLAFSVPATEHSVMTALGEEGEWKVVDKLFREHPTGILSVVADSYDIYRFVDAICTTYRKQVLDRDGVFVVRPDSTTPNHETPEGLTLWIVRRLYESFGGAVNSKGFKVLDPHVRVLWGDGIDSHGIVRILGRLAAEGFSAENMVFGMGGGLHQKVNRDMQRFAFKCSAQERDGAWHQVYKKPLDTSKASKRGRLALVKDENGYRTVGGDTGLPDELVTVFENGVLLNEVDFDTVRRNAAL